MRRRGATDPNEDALGRRHEEFRRCLIEVLGPAFAELRAALRREGRDVAVRVSSAPGAPTEATLAVSHRGAPGPASDARAITRADVVRSVLADYRALRRARSDG